MKRLFYLFVLLITAVCGQSCMEGMDGVWTCTKATIVGKNYDELPEFTKRMLDGNVGATMTFRGDEVVDAQKKKGRIDMVKGGYHFSDERKVLTVNFKKESVDGGKTWKELPQGLPADFDYQVVSLTDNQLIFQFEQGGGVLFEYTYEKE